MGQDGHRLISLAVHQPIDAALKPGPQGLKQHRHHAGGGQGDKQVAFSAKDSPQVANDKDIQAVTRAVSVP
ncbi:MAG: hypothetical protein U0401_14385 [Anaerolineae bacterium]